MDKSLVVNVLAVKDAIFQDCILSYPKLKKSLGRDSKRITSLINDRGLSSVLVDLPLLDRILLDGLENEHLTASGPLTRPVSKQIRVPRLLSGLWLLVFDKSGCLKADPDINAILFIRQITTCFKSLKLQCPQTATNAAVGEYYEIESELREPSLPWDGTVSVHDASSVHFSDLFRSCDPNEYTESTDVSLMAAVKSLQSICDDVSGWLGLYDPYEFTNSAGYHNSKRTFSHGRGSVSDQKWNGNRYHFPSWTDRLQQVFPIDAFGSTNFSIPDVNWIEDPKSKLIAVPKDYSKPRLIASEPVCHQWCQQITLQWLSERIKGTKLGNFIDFQNQRFSHDLVVRSSVDKSLATVDLSSASDRLTCWSVERMFRKNFTVLSALNAHRSRIITNSITNKADIPLRKFASQGTAVTFPIQSIFFLCCVLASLGCNKLRDSDDFIGQVRVYGDDIIIPVHGLDTLKSLLTYLQLKVNPKKTFSKGNFRESCGLDAYKGYDITPCKPKTLTCRGPESQLALVDSSNNLFKKGFWRTAEILQSIATEKYLILPVVRMDSGVVGWASFCGGNYSFLRKKRWNSDLHRNEVCISTFVVREQKQPINDNTAFFQFITERPSQLTNWKSGYGAVSQLRKKKGWVEIRE